MKTIETEVTITADGQLIAHVDAQQIPAGQYHAVLVLETPPAEPKSNQWGILDIPPLSVGEWPEGLKLISREEYYGDDER
jgi:hypothetical protein